MQPVHTCSQDCETLHKEISKKLLLILLGSRSQSLLNSGSSANKSNNWFGLETPPFSGLQDHEEEIKTFCSSSGSGEERKIVINVYLDNEEGLIGIEEETNGSVEGGQVRREALRKAKILLESWTIKFYPKTKGNVNANGDEEIRKLYKRTSLFIRSFYTITRLLPVYPMVKQKLPICLEKIVTAEADWEGEAKLCESWTSSSGNSESFESVDGRELSELETNHGDIKISVRFKKISGIKFYSIVRSPAIRVPQQVIKAKDIQIKSSPVATAIVGSGDWVEMSNQQQQQQQQQQKRRSVGSATPGQVKILTTAHKPTSSLKQQQQQSSLPDFIKLFEKVPPDLLETTRKPTTPLILASQLIQILELGRSKKIHFDRWLEELEIEHERLMGSSEFDLVNNME